MCLPCVRSLQTAGTMNELTPLFAAAAISGLSGTPHCLAMCGGFAASCRGGPALLAWHVGRLSTYAGLGMVAATVGGALPGPGWIPAIVSLALIVWFAGAIAGVVPEPSIRWPFVDRLVLKGGEKTGFFPTLLMGIANGLLPCGLVYAALALPVASGRATYGALLMLAFGLGTVPGLSVLARGVQRWTVKGRWRRWLVGAAVLTAGLWSVVMRQSMTMDLSHNESHEAVMERREPAPTPNDEGGAP